MSGILNVRTDVDACDCTLELYGHRLNKTVQFKMVYIYIYLCARVSPYVRSPPPPPPPPPQRLSGVPSTLSFSLKQFTVQDGMYLCARDEPVCTLPPPPPPSSLNVVLQFQTVPLLVSLTMAVSRPLKEDRLALPLSTLLFSLNIQASTTDSVFL